MSEENKLIPDLRFPEFLNNGEWEEKKLDYLIDLFSGIALKSEEITDDESGIPILRGINITEGYIRHTKDIDKFFLGEIKSLEKYFVKENDIVIGMDGSKVGKNIALVGKEDENSILIQRVARIRTNKNSEIYFIYQCFISDQFKSYVDKVNTSSGIPHISAQQIKDFKIGVPPKIKEQQKIASCLSSLDEVITAHSQKLELLKEHKKSLMQNLFPQEGESVPTYRFPEFVSDGAWLSKKLGDLLEFKNGINASKEQYGKGIKFINVLDILKNEPITYENIIGNVDIDDITLQKNSVTFGDILFQRSSETQEEVGSANVYLDKDKTATFGGFVIRGKKIGDYDPLFLNALLKTNKIRQSISLKAGGSTRFNVGQETLASTIIILPRQKEQQKIASCLSSLDEIITAQAEKIEQLKLHKKGLMQGLFPKMNE